MKDSVKLSPVLPEERSNLFLWGVIGAIIVIVTALFATVMGMAYVTSWMQPVAILIMWLGPGTVYFATLISAFIGKRSAKRTRVTGLVMWLGPLAIFAVGFALLALFTTGLRLF